MMRKIAFVLATLFVGPLLITQSAFAASREQQEMQRDIAQLQDQVRALQSGFDQKMAALQTLVQQALDAGNKANTGVSVLSSSVQQALERALRDGLGPVAGVSSKVDNLGNDMAAVQNNLTDLTSQMNKVRQQLTDLNNAVKVLQAPPAPPPGVDTARGQTPPPVPAQKLFTDAMSDYSSGKSDLAIDEFTNFVKLYPDDPSAPTAQLFIGQTRMGQGKFEQAAEDFDVVLERFPESDKTPDAWFEKAMALKQAKHSQEAAKEFRALRAKYPHSDQAKAAGDQLRAMGLSLGAPPPPAAKKK
jgi:tol-pal system protein YbgF